MEWRALVPFGFLLWLVEERGWVGIVEAVFMTIVTGLIAGVALLGTVLGLVGRGIVSLWGRSDSHDRARKARAVFQAAMVIVSTTALFYGFHIVSKPIIFTMNPAPGSFPVTYVPGGVPTVPRIGLSRRKCAGEAVGDDPNLPYGCATMLHSVSRSGPCFRGHIPVRGVMRQLAEAKSRLVRDPD